METLGLVYLIVQPGMYRILRRGRFSPSTGCNYAELAVLYYHIRRFRPTEVLELGSGLSTVVMAHAALRNSVSGAPCFVTSMEEATDFAAATWQIIPERLARNVDIVVSEVTAVPEPGGWVAVGYRELPGKPYDMVFIDGPQLPDNSRDSMYYDADVLRVARSSGGLVALLDGRESTKVRLSREDGLITKRGKYLTKFTVSPS